MGFWSGLGKVLGGAGAVLSAPFTGGASLGALPAILGAGGAAIGAMSGGAAKNRGEEFGGQMDLASLLLSRELGQANLQGQADRDFFDQSVRREQEGRDSRSSAWRGLLSAERTLNPSQRPMLSPYSVAQRMPSEGERGGAEALKAEVMARLMGGNPIAAPERRQVNIGMPGVDASLLRPGGMERLGGILSPILTGAGAIMDARQPRQPLPSGRIDPRLVMYGAQ